jgi:dihydrodipicolinate synthase/N-acetylneuraminate lyase
MTRPQGAFAPIPTPLDRTGRIDPDALHRHLRWLAGEGLDGALVLGTNGEFPSFDLTERLELAGATARADSGLDLMLGVGSCALPEVRRMLRAAFELGYQTALLPPPFYFRTAPVAGLIDFFNAALDAAELPVLLYHIPQVTGIEISDAVLDGVGNHPRCAGVKDSSGDPAELERFTSRLDGRAYMVGHDRLIGRSMARGGGSITAAASVAPALVAATQRNPALQPTLTRVRELLETRGLGPAVKAILRARGFGDYATRPPLVGLDDAEAEQLVAEFDLLVPP